MRILDDSPLSTFTLTSVYDGTGTFTRPSDSLVAVTGGTPSVNQWGVTVYIGSDGIVTSIKSYVAETITVPSGGFVLTGHGKGAYWLSSYAAVGRYITRTGNAVKIYENAASSEIVTSKPDNPANGLRWRDNITGKLYVYSSAVGQWIAQTQNYIMLSFVDTDYEDSGEYAYIGERNGVRQKDLQDNYTLEPFEGFKEGDAITISGISKKYDSTYVIASIAAHGLILNGFIDEKITKYISADNTVTISRKVPQMDFVVECNNRLWGCYYGHKDKNVPTSEVLNEIYCSALGDPTNWYKYEGTAMDSWTASVGEPGAWTGAAVYGGYPIFFKENAIIRIYGTAPSSFQVAAYNYRGVKATSHRSLAIVDEVLFYHSCDGFVAYTGGVPTKIDSALGHAVYSDAVGGSFGSKYYVSAKCGGKYSVLVYDTATGLWHKEDDTKALMSGFAAGVAEYIGEKVSLGYFFDNILHGTMSAATVKEFFKSAGKWALGSVIEGSEEVFTNAMNRFADYIINSDHSNMELAVQNYISQGYSAEEAKNKAANDWWTETFYDFWGGFVGGSLMGGAALAGNVAVNTKNKIQNTARQTVRQTVLGEQLSGTEAGVQLTKTAEQLGIDTSKASKEVKQRSGVGKLIEKIQTAVKNKNTGKLADKVIDAELKKAKSAALEVLGEGDNNDLLAQGIAEISVGIAGEETLNMLTDLGLVNEENANLVAEAFSAVDKNTESGEVHAVIRSITDEENRGERRYTAKEIASVKHKDGKTVYVTNEGEEISPSRAVISNAEQILFDDCTKGMTEEESAEMIEAYHKYGTNAHSFGMDWRLARSMGIAGITVNSERFNDYNPNFSSDEAVNRVLQTQALEQGAKAKARMKAENTIKEKAARVIKNRGRAKGEVRGKEKLTEKKGAALNVANTLARCGYDIEFFTGEIKVNGKKLKGTPNGVYDPNTNTIYLRADAEYEHTSVQEILGHTLAHEVTHSIQTWNEDQYDELVKYIQDVLGDQYKELVDQKRLKLGLEYHEAVDEVICDGCEMLLKNSKALEKIATENANLFVRIGKAIKEFIAKLRKSQKDMYEDVGELHDAAVRLRETLKSFEELQSIFDEALTNSIRNMRNALAEAENAETKATLDVLEKAAEDEGLEFQGLYYESLRFSKEGDKNDSIYIIERIAENADKIPSAKVFDVKSTKIQGRASDYVYSVFESQGNIAHNSEIGDVDLGIAGAKSTVFHGYGDSKLAAVKAIKPTIEHGTIISKTENYKNTGVDRYIIAAKGNINGKESYVGVMVKAYPNARLNSKFYLHEATIIETDPHIMTAALKSNKTVSESASNPSIAKDKQTVNPSETNSSDKLRFSRETSEEFAENEKKAIENALENMSLADYNKRGWARSLLTREDAAKLEKAIAEAAKNGGKNSGMLMKDGTLAIEVNNKIVFADDNFEDPSYYAVLVFDTDNATDMELSKYIYLGGIKYNNLTKFDINRIIHTEGNKFGTYGYNARDYDASRKESAGRATLKSYTKGFGDVSQLIVRGGVYTKNERSVSRSVQGVTPKKADKSKTASMTRSRIEYLIKDSGAGNRTDYAQAWITSINPTDFLNMTLSEKGQNREYFDKMPGDYGSTVDEYDYIEGLKKETRQTPFLAIDYESGDVVGHEGRHRMRALEKEGITNVEICVQFRDSDGRLIKTLNGYGKPLTTISSLEIFNQRGTGQASTIFNIIPLNSAHSEEIFASYGQNDAKIVFSEETDENTKAVRNDVEDPRATLISDMESVASSVEEMKFVEEYKKVSRETAKLQEKLNEVNRQIKEAMFTKGADRSVLPELQKQKKMLLKSLQNKEKILYDFRGNKLFKNLANSGAKLATIELREKINKRAEEQLKRRITGDIVKRLDAIDAKAKTDSKTKHIPSELKKIVAQLRLAINPSTQDYAARIEAAQKDIVKYNTAISRYEKAIENGADRRKYTEYISNAREMIKKKQGIIEMYQKRQVNVSKYLKELKDFYSQFEKTDDNKDSAIYSIDTKDIAEEISDLTAAINGRALYELSADELQDVLDVTKKVQKSISNANKMFREARSVEAEAKIINNELLASGRKEKFFGKRNPLRAARNFRYEMTKPYLLFKNSGSEEMYSLYRKLQSTEGKVMHLIKKYSDKFRTEAEKNKVTNKQLKERHDITLASGETIVLTSGEIMTLYLSAKREQGAKHLLDTDNGGFALSEGEMRYRVNGKLDVSTPNGRFVKLTQNDFAVIESALDKNLKDFADTMQKYMSDEMSSDGNQVSMRLYDVALFNDKFYIPLNVSAANRNADTEGTKKKQVKASNQSFTHKTNKYAKGGLLIDSFENVFAQHAYGMAKYAGMTLELEDMAKVLNTSVGAVKLREMFGPKLGQEMIDFLTDANGGVRGDDINLKLFTNFKAAKVAISTRVAIQQWGAIFRSMAYIDSKYFIGKPFRRNTEAGLKTTEEMMKYTSTWIVKDMGGFDVGTSATAKEILTDLGKGKSFLKKANNAVQKVEFFLAETGDKLAWTMMFEACKREAIDNFKKSNTEYTYEDVLKTAGKRFDEITNNTQVYDSVFSRSKIMRSGSTYKKIITAFMAESITTTNMVMDAVYQFGHGNKKQGGRILSSLLVTGLFNVIVKTFIDALRDDDDDKGYWEKYLSSLVSNAIDEINPLTDIPIARDVWSLVQGYDAERSDMSLVSGLIDRANSLFSAKNDEEKMNAGISLTNSIIDLFGIGASNLEREIRSIVNTVGNKWDETTKTNIVNGVIDSLANQTIFTKRFAKSRDDRIYYAFMHDDSEYIEEFRQFCDREYGDKAEEKYNGYIVNGLKDNDYRVALAAAAHMDGDTEKYLDYIDDISADGFDEKLVQKAILSAENKLSDEDSVISAIDGTLLTKKDIISDVESGGNEYIGEYYEAKSDYYKEKGDKDYKKKARTATKSMLTDYYKPIYEEADSAERKKIRSILLKVKIDGKYLYDSSSFDNWDE